jgi:hypothetical protein
VSADAGGVRLWRNGDSAVFIRGDAETARVCRPQAEAYVAWPAAQAEAMEAVVRDAVELCRQQLPHRLLDLPDSVRRYLSTLTRAPGGEGGA